MTILLLLAPFSVFLGLLAVAAFVWTLRNGQYDDIRGSAERILMDEADTAPTRPDLHNPGAPQAAISTVAAGSAQTPPGTDRNEDLG